MIDKLVISGGGPEGLQFLGALKVLEELGVWRRDHIRHIFAVSVGTFMAVLIALDFEWDVIIEYIVSRPWERDLVKTNIDQLLEAYDACGFINQEYYSIFFMPFFKAKDVSLDVTLKEFYDLYPVHLHLYAVNVNNNFEMVEVSHETFPDMPLLTAVQMSSSIPMLIAPVFWGVGGAGCAGGAGEEAEEGLEADADAQDEGQIAPPKKKKNKKTTMAATTTTMRTTNEKSGCFMDGGLVTSYPILECFEYFRNSTSDKSWESDEDNLKSILGVVKVDSHNNSSTQGLYTGLTEDMSYLTFSAKFVKMAIQNGKSYRHTATLLGMLPHEVVVHGEQISMSSFHELMSCKAWRESIIEKGAAKGKAFYEKCMESSTSSSSTEPMSSA